MFSFHELQTSNIKLMRQKSNNKIDIFSKKSKIFLLLI